MLWSKCDERLPCRNCINRHEKCEKPNPRPLAVRSQLPQQPATSSHVNKLHIELFYHFTKVTQYTLTFSEIWETQLQESFKACLEYLVDGGRNCITNRDISTTIFCMPS